MATCLLPTNQNMAGPRSCAFRTNHQLKRKNRRPMRRAFAFCLLLMATRCLAQTDSISQRIFLIGDAGELFGGNGTQPVIDWLQTHVDWNDHRNTAIFLGDNIYPLGLPQKGEPGYQEAKDVIDYLVK